VLRNKYQGDPKKIALLNAILEQFADYNDANPLHWSFSWIKLIQIQPSGVQSILSGHAKNVIGQLGPRAKYPDK
jgi:hypothetical protein